MKKTMRLLSMAALALVGAVMTGCSSDDNIIDQPQQPETPNNVVTLTTTVSLGDGDATTRALTSTGVKTFAEGETMAIIYKNTSNQTVKAVSEPLPAGDYGASATFTFTLEDPSRTGNVTYIYPAAMAAATVATDAAVDAEANVNYAALATQDGTLATLSSSLDYCMKSGAWDSENLPTAALENQLAILAINLKNEAGSSDITNTVTSMVVSDGANAYTVNRTAAAGPIYVAILPTSDATISVTATDGSKNYAKSLSNKTYSASNGYSVSWRMTDVAVRDLSMLDCAGNLRPRSWTANCYMVHTAGDYKLPLVYGNAIKNGATNAAAYTGVSGQLETFPRHDGSAITGPWIKDNSITVATADLLWQDATGLVTAVGIDGDYLTLTVGKNAAAQEGNAMVAAKDGSGNIVWSWHIWVTKQTFAAADLATVATGNHTYQLTPVNLGWVGDAVSRGYNTFYQWGRKDPFIPTTGTANTNHTVYNISNATVTGRTYSTSSATIADNIKNPTTFYNVSNNPNTSTANNLWDAQQTSTGNIATATVKTVYDPCPAGFCVPTGNLYYYISGQASTLDNTNKGRTLTSVSPNVFFPSSGCHQETGGIYGVGNTGYYWSASPNSSSRGQTLGTWLWGESGLGWQDYLRAFCFPVRPVAEE